MNFTSGLFMKNHIRRMVFLRNSGFDLEHNRQLRVKEQIRLKVYLTVSTLKISTDPRWLVSDYMITLCRDRH